MQVSVAWLRELLGNSARRNWLGQFRMPFRKNWL